MALDHHVFFGTFTYNEEMIPYKEFDQVDSDTGEVIGKYKVRYADINDFQDAVKRIRKYDGFTRPFSYFLVSEFGGEKGRPHFHCLFFLPKYPDDTFMDVANLEYILFNVFLKEWKRNVNVLPGMFTKGGKLRPSRQKVNTRHPIWKPLCTYYRRWICGKLSANYDLHYVIPSVESDSSSVAAYVTKYMLKPSDREKKLQQALRLNLTEEDYEKMWFIVKPRWVASKNFGSKTDLQKKKVLDCISSSKSSGEKFPLYLADNGNSYPLSRYYKRKFLSVLDEYGFQFNDPDRLARDNFKPSSSDVYTFDATISVFRNKVDLVDSHDTMSNLLNEF